VKYIKKEVKVQLDEIKKQNLKELSQMSFL